MTPRSLRRAQERKARKEMERKSLKAARQAAAHQTEPVFRAYEPDESVPVSQEPRMQAKTSYTSEALCWDREIADESPENHLLFTPAPLSPARLVDNRANAQLSTGPTSSDGKAAASLNAVKTALTGRTVLLSSDDAADYDLHLRNYAAEFRPVGAREADLVQSIADTMWRLRRIPALEAAIFAQGHVEFAQAFNNHEVPLRASMIEVQTFMKYEKQLRNLQLQEARLARRREKEIAELRQLQADRERQQMSALAAVSRLYLEAKKNNVPFEPPVINGFVFSTAEIEQNLRGRNLFTSVSEVERSHGKAA